MDSVPMPLGFTAFPPEWLRTGAARAAPPFRPLVGAPVASLRCRILRPGEVSINRSRRSGDILKSLNIQEKPQELWIGVVEVKPLNRQSYGAAGAFTNIVTWARNIEEFRRNPKSSQQPSICMCWAWRTRSP